MPKNPYKAEKKERTCVGIYPSTKAKAKRLGVNVSQLLEDAIANLPEQKNGGS